MVSSYKKTFGKNSTSLIALRCIKFCFPISIGIFIGFFLGSSTTANYRTLLESEISSLTKTAATATAEAATSSSSSDSPLGVETDKEGWHPIFVYYGKSDAIKAKNAPLETKSNIMEGSQVKQDEMIATLVTTYRERVKTKTSSGNIGNDYDSSRPPYFVDLAANDAISLSNTYKLEKLGFEGLCVEPNPVYWFRLAHRKCLVAGAFVGGNKDLQEVEVSLENKEYGGIVGADFDNKRIAQKEKRFTVSIRTMFEQFDVPKRVDYLSLDVEGAEELIMKDFPFDMYTISFVTIERPNLGLQELMEQNGYLFVMLLVNWGETIWVHRSVLGLLTMEEIKDIVSKKKQRERRLTKGSRYFDVKKGELTTF